MVKIKEKIICPKCGRTLIESYNIVFHDMRCKCGKWINTTEHMRDKFKEAKEERRKARLNGKH